MRVEDIDRPRCKPELRETALEDLTWLGLDWDAGPHAGDQPGEYDQHTRFDRYREHLDKLIEAGDAYPCTCSRKDIEQASSAPHADEGAIYPGTCRDRWESLEHAKAESGVEPAWRFRWADSEVFFRDQVAGDVVVKPSTLGDFVLWRRDDLPSYQLAVAVDDAEQGVSQVVRGRDLLTSAARQLSLYCALGLRPPAKWGHLPFVQDAQGRRMAKRDGDLALIHLRETGVAAERVIGLCAWSAGLIDNLEPVSAPELVGEFSMARIAGKDFLVTAEHIDWLNTK